MWRWTVDIDMDIDTGMDSVIETDTDTDTDTDMVVPIINWNEVILPLRNKLSFVATTNIFVIWK